MSWWKAIAAWTVLAGSVALAYGWTLGAYFVADDFGYINRFASFPFASWPGLFVADWSGGIWGTPLNELRPFTALSFIIDTRLWGGNAGGYHLTNLLLHLFCSGLVMLIARATINVGWPGALLAGVLFALHPVHREAVIWITGRVDLLSAAGLLLGFYGFLRYRAEPRWAWLAVAWCAYGFGIFAKESALLLPFVALLSDRAFRGPEGRPWRQEMAPFAGWAAAAAVYIGCRLSAMGGSATVFEIADVLFGLARGIRRIVMYSGAMFLPRGRLSSLYERLAPYQGVVAALIIAAIVIALIAALRVPRWRRSDAIRATVFFGAAWPIVLTMPLVVTYYSTRHLYAPTAGFIIGAVAALGYVLSRRVAFAAAAAVLVAGVAAQSIAGMRNWQETQALSRQINEAVAEVARRSANGDLIVLDVPELVNGRWVWAWAVPFALRPPFHATDVRDRLIVLSPPGVYRYPEAWPSPRTTDRLERASGGGWLISSTPGRAVTIRQLAPESVSRIQDGPLDTHEAFDRAVDSLEPARP
ncbi:MAG: glycosyltransferase family 39 protein [Vicinamibacterales bacterium]